MGDELGNTFKDYIIKDFVSMLGSVNFLYVMGSY